MEQPERPQVTIKHGPCAFLAGYLRLQTHTQNKYVILYHSNNGRANVPQYYVYTYNACLAFLKTNSN